MHLIEHFQANKDIAIITKILIQTFDLVVIMKQCVKLELDENI